MLEQAYFQNLTSGFATGGLLRIVPCAEMNLLFSSFLCMHLEIKFLEGLCVFGHLSVVFNVFQLALCRRSGAVGASQQFVMRAHGGIPTRILCVALGIFTVGSLHFAVMAAWSTLDSPSTVRVHPAAHAQIKLSEFKVGDSRKDSNTKTTRAVQLLLTAAAARTSGDDEWCNRIHDAERVQPGRSWGTLGESGVQQWKVRRCDRFFCKPNHMEAKGSYVCEPLRSSP